MKGSLRCPPGSDTADGTANSVAPTIARSSRLVRTRARAAAVGLRREMVSILN
jgi:hypothetical protein